MNSPTVSSIPASSTGRPDTVAPKTTSSSPACRDSSSAHAPCTAVLSVTPRRRASSASASVPSGGSSRAAAPNPSSGLRGVRGTGSGVGASKPASAALQKRSARPRSCRSSQSTYSR